MELLDLIVNECEEAMTREEAEAYREKLMGERSVAVRDSNSSYFEVVSAPSFSSLRSRNADWAHLGGGRDSICGVVSAPRLC